MAVVVEFLPVRVTVEIEANLEHDPAVLLHGAVTVEIKADLEHDPAVLLHGAVTVEMRPCREDEEDEEVVVALFSMN